MTPEILFEERFEQRVEMDVVSQLSKLIDTKPIV